VKREESWRNKKTNWHKEEDIGAKDEEKRKLVEE
jgi:hypothetical protein